MKLFFETFGCRLNRAEALQREADLLARGHVLAEGHADADVILIRGCSVTARAQRDCELLIDHLRRKYPTTRLIIEGCLPEEAKSRPDALDLPVAHDGKRTQAGETVPTRTARAYLKVQDGCSSKCSFCIVPRLRGPSVSVPFDNLLARAREFIDAGYHEIVITGCNLAQYLDDGRRLPELVAAIAELDPAGMRVRLGSVEPGAVARDLIPVMKDHPNVCRYLHIPVQSGSNDILAHMKRPYFAKDVEDLAHLAEAAMPGIALGCDIITGFPGENEIDFHATFSQLKRLGFAKAHIFPYSERPGTPATETMLRQIGKDVRRTRAHLIDTYMKKARAEYASSFIGKTVEIVNERRHHLEGWTGEYLWCKSVGFAPRKSLVKVFINRADGDILHGRML